MSSIQGLLLVLIFIVFGCTSDTSTNSTTVGQAEEFNHSSEVEVNILNDAYFGETHLHTSYSLDAYIGGNRLTPEDALRFAMGEVVTSNNRQMRIKTPLDFCAITDHAEYVGEMYSVLTPGAPGYDSDIPAQMRSASTYEEAIGLFVELVVKNNRSSTPQHLDFWQGVEVVESFWNKQVELVDKYNNPGTFTTIQGFEWSAAPNGGNLHRNILFRDSNVPKSPVSYIEINREEELWDWLDSIETTGCRAIAIPHNSNASKGMMFSENDSKGNPITSEYAVKRERFERLVEIMQIKGASEVHADFWASDEFASFENCPSMAKYSGRTFEERNFVRDALKRGLKYHDDLGTNPYKLGMVGGTDNHNSLTSNTAEDNYYVGSHGYADNTAQARAANVIDGWAQAYDVNAGAITGVWAESNSREAIWDAMHRRETFATSGNRIKVRMFGGVGYKASYSDYEDMVADGYTKGVPMGSDLEISDGDSPQFIVWAEKDAREAPLDRIQIIKGWYRDGELKEKIYNIAASNGRKMAPDGTIAALDAPVDLLTGAFASSKGSPQLHAVWTDPDFNKDDHAFYYVRVLQIPTARWTLWDEIREGVSYPDDVPRTVVERAWSSPIWYSPN